MKHFIYFMVTSFLIHFSFAVFSQEQKVDAGIFSGSTPDTLIIKARPGYQISGQSLTNSQLTVKWSESSPITELQWLYTSTGLYPQGSVITYEGFRYQVYGSFGGSNLNWTAGQEYVILKLKTNSFTGSCTEFEIAQDDWTLANNGDYYFEVLGEDHTGILYVPDVNFGSEGGHIEGDTSIYLGNATGIMNLISYNGNVLQWERKINQGQWSVLPGTEGLLSYEDVPTLEGSWEYRAKVEKPGCLPQYSEPAIITVELLAVWTGVVNTLWDNPGNWNIVGVPDATLDCKIPEMLIGDYPLIEDEAYARNLFIDVNASLVINPGGILTTSGFIKNEGTFTMLTDTLSAASLLDNGISGEGYFICDFEVHPDRWYMVSSPVMNALSGAFEGMSINRWDEMLFQWTPVILPYEFLGIFKGYLAMSSSINQSVVNLEGDGLFSGPLQAGLTNNGMNEGHSGGFNLIGNPYPSAINWNDPYNWILEQVDPVIYIFQGDAGNYGTYLMNDPGSSTLGTDNIIGMHQGFFVHVNHDATSGSIALNNNVRLHDTRNIRKIQSILTNEPYLRLKAFTSESSLMDEVVVRFNNGATPGFDSGFDAYDLSGQADAPGLFTRNTDTLRLAVNSYPPLLVNTVIPMGFIPGEENSYTLKVEEMLNVGTDTLIFVEDLIMDTIYQLNPGFQFDFTASAVDDPDRFLIHFQVEPVAINNFISSEAFNLFTDKQQLVLYTSEEDFNGHIEIIDICGRILLKKEVSGSYNVINIHVKQGMYLVRICSENLMFVKKVMINY